MQEPQVWLVITKTRRLASFCRSWTGGQLESRLRVFYCGGIPGRSWTINLDRGPLMKTMIDKAATALALVLLSCPLASGTTITFDEFPADQAGLPSGTLPATRYAFLGVTFMGTDDGSAWSGLSAGDPGNWGLEGTNGTNFSGYNGSSYSMKLLTSTGAFSPFRLDVARSNGSSSSDTFTLQGYRHGVLVESTTVPLNIINMWKTVSLIMVADEVRWNGTGNDFHPYGIDNLNFTIVPEPSTLTLAAMGFIGLAWRLRRR